MLVDFAAWASPTLDIPLGGRTYVVRPPTVGEAAKILACTVRAELSLGLAKGELSPEMAETFAKIEAEPLAVVTLTREVYDQMVADDLPEMVIIRAGFYAMLYWARGKARADSICAMLWDEERDPEVARPKDPSPSTSGHSTA